MCKATTIPLFIQWAKDSLACYMYDKGYCDGLTLTAFYYVKWKAYSYIQTEQRNIMYIPPLYLPQNMTAAR